MTDLVSKLEYFEKELKSLREKYSFYECLLYDRNNNEQHQRTEFVKREIRIHIKIIENIVETIKLYS